MKIDEIQKLIADLIPVIKEYVDQAVSGLRQEHSTALEGVNQFNPDDIAIAAAELIEPGKKGEPGQDGVSIMIDDIEPMIKEFINGLIAEIPPAEKGNPGKDGTDGDDGKSVDPTDVELMVAEQLSKALESLEIPKDGEPGRDAVDIDIQPCIDFDKSYPRGTFASYLGGLWRSHAKTNGQRGWDCIVRGESAFNIKMDGHRTIVVTSTDTVGDVKESRFDVPVWIYRNVWKDVDTYKQGDVVTWGGSLWHCDEPTGDKPTENSKAWTLCAKKGRDGKR